MKLACPPLTTTPPASRARPEKICELYRPAPPLATSGAKRVSAGVSLSLVTIERVAAHRSTGSPLPSIVSIR